MGGSFLNPTMATGIMDSQYQARAEIEDTRWHRPNWNYERRGPAAHRDRYGWHDLWPGSQMMNGDPGSPMTTFGNCAGSGGEYFEATTVPNSGTQSTKFIKGTCLDGSGNPVAGATIKGYVAATDVFVGSVQSRLDGSYDLGTANLASTAHYVTAYKAGSPDIAGTSVNTLLPTNIDGT